MSPQFTAKLYNLLVLLLLCLWLNCHGRSGIDNKKGIECMESERDALLEFKRGIRVDRCGFLDSWGLTQDCCMWHGVQCHNYSGHVIALDLPSFINDYAYIQEPCLKGTIGVSILGLKQLKYIDLSFNDFGGQLPKFIGSLSNLEYLKLSHMSFTGVIPEEIGNLSRLTTLDLSSPNNMRVENFLWLSQLRLLREVNLGGIDLSVASRSWVSIISNIPFLQVLLMDNCNISLKLSSSLSYINSSKTLDTISLYGNNLNDTSIFEWLSNFGELETNLVYLDLSYNQKLFENNFQGTGKAMNFLGNLCSLQSLSLSNTSLSYDFSDIIQSLSACSHKSLMNLVLSYNQLWGSIPNDIGKLSNLTELDVEYNQLNGTNIQALGGLSMLETMSISSNSLKGDLTSVHLSNLSKLSYLSLASNTELVINISANWVPPFQLDVIILTSCKVGPDFPIWLITQKNLHYIDISNTSIFAKIPDSFFNSLSSTLLTLYMSNNMMYGILPDSSITFLNPPWIDLSSNNFSGGIPLFMRNATALTLNNNNLSQGLVPFLCPQTKMPLIFLDLSNNSFSGKIPDCWGYFDKLLMLHLENNSLWGSLPISIGKLNQLSALHLSSNNLSGELPTSILNCTSLIILDLADNSLCGYIPSTFGNYFKNLSIFILRDNNFFGGLPSSLCHLSRLQMLDFSSNRINGTIPRCIYNLKGMVSTDSLLQTISYFFTPGESMVYAVDNAFIVWKGKKQYIGNIYLLGHVKTIDISNNILEGQIPEGISSLVGLTQINLSRNHLSGAITSRIGQLTSLESLDLSHNHLSGEIPLSLVKISTLDVLNLSYNNLSGMIPHGTQLQSFNTSSYMGNPRLCGAPLPNCDGHEVAIIPQNNVNVEPRNDNFMLGVYISVVLGFIIGFWGVCGTLVLKTSWRHALFRFYDDVKDRVFAMVVVKMRRV